MPKRKRQTALPPRVEAFAREYVQLTEALMREGVPENEARTEAHMAALALLTPDAPESDGPPCPLCGR